MSRMRNNMWAFPIMIIMKIEYTISGKTSLPEFALFIKFIISYKQRQMGHIFIWLFFIIFRRIISSKWVPQVTKHPVYLCDNFAKILKIVERGGRKYLNEKLSTF